jgi:hypothetical protein
MANTTAAGTGERVSAPKTVAVGRSAGSDGLAILESDHRDVETCFRQFDDLVGDGGKKALVAQLCLALRIHGQIEEEIFYPQALESTGDGDLLAEVIAAHTHARALIAEIEVMQPGEEFYDMKVRELGDRVRRHVRIEEEELFPDVCESGLDLRALAVALLVRKAELKEAAGLA